MTSSSRVRTGRVTPAPDPPDGLRVEQVGWGVARQVSRLLTGPGGSSGDDVLLEDVVRLAEAPGFLAHAVFLGRTAVALSLVSLPGDGSPQAADEASYVGAVVAPDAPSGTREALLVRALHDVGSAGVPWLGLPPAVAATWPADEVDLHALGFG